MAATALAAAAAVATVRKIRLSMFPLFPRVTRGPKNICIESYVAVNAGHQTLKSMQAVHPGALPRLRRGERATEVAAVQCARVSMVHRRGASVPVARQLLAQRRIADRGAASGQDDLPRRGLANWEVRQLGGPRAAAQAAGFVHPRHTEARHRPAGRTDRVVGGTNWSPMSYNAETGLFYVPGTIRTSAFAYGDIYKKGKQYNGGTQATLIGSTISGTWATIRGNANKIAWQQAVPYRVGGGPTTAAGDLLLHGDPGGASALAYSSARSARAFFASSQAAGMSMATVSHLPSRGLKLPLTPRRRPAATSSM